MELLAEFRHVVAWNVLVLLKLPGVVSNTTVFAKFAFPKMHHIFAHLSFLLFLHIVVEILAFLVVSKCFFKLLACCLTVVIAPSWRSLICRAVIG